jgi:endoglucanase
VTAAHFAAFWGELARRCVDQPHVIFGLQNEPHDQDKAVLAGVHNAAIAAIRQTGARHLILVPGSAWTGAHSWISSGNARAALTITDPLETMAFDVHQYLDADSSGRVGGCTEGAGARLQAFTHWAREHGKRGFLGEFGAGGGALCLTETRALLGHIAENRDVWLGWTAWGGGAWWPADYPLALATEERAQLTLLRTFFE